ncbi:hypothetical protein GcM3_008011 [Golovinomyces cichoracearum]|uniref:Uncharacterized protein n=1 Tax=Golovinomyces cichoracearum TaxID=62708 RepID=A0A420JAF4_9PEZI|nr:hypothetical protein GcM3_008011 [Golovinomyces cichoracearum]
MPRFPKGFGRRKTLAPPDKTNDNHAEQSFKVFNRSEESGKSLDGGIRLFKPIPATVKRTSSKQADDYNLFENIGSNHSSGASNTLTSVTDNSSRLSATSTVPSSTDNTNAQEWSSPHDKPFINIPLPPAPRKSSVFSLKNASHAISLGKLKNSSNSDIPPPSPSEISEEDIVGARMRAVTSSSYASTTVPPKLNEKDGHGTFDGKTSQTFSEVQETGIRERRPESFLPSTKQSRSYPTPLDLVKTKVVEVSPALSSSYNSSEALLHGNSSSAFESRHSPRSPLVPQHVPIRGSSPLSSHNNDLRYEIQLDNETGRRSTSCDRNLVPDAHSMPLDEDAQLLQESINASRRLNEQSQEGEDDWPASQSPPERFNTHERVAESLDRSGHGTGARKFFSSENMHDNTIAVTANLAQRYQERSLSPPTSRSSHMKVMTPAQFERYKQDQDRLRNLRVKNFETEEDEEDDTNYDDGDDDDAVEKAKAVARQRRKQEAHMAVYRQQMMKVIGETPSNSATRPSMFASQSSPNLSNIGQPDDTEEEEDEEVPLGILQAHGFPSKNKTPQIRNNRSSSNLKAAAGSAAPSGLADSRLPVFARNLPHDPYYGSSLVKSMHRESLAFAGGSSSSNGVMKGLPPGGLVGVIATEERSRALRRGSPNAQAEYPVQVPPNTIGIAQNSNEPLSTMHNMVGPGNLASTGATSSMINPVDQAQMHMTHQMQQFMQMQMQFMQMMSQRRPQSPNHTPQSPSYTPHLPELPRPASAQLHQRSLTMMNHNSAPWLNRASTYSPSLYAANGYAPSIAPSERSNVGLPGRYRPVSQAPPMKLNRAKTSSVCGDLQSWDDKTTTRASTLIKVVDSKSGNISDEDEDEAWAKLAMKKKEKKSAWRTKKDRDSNGLKEMLNYLN